MMSIIEQLARYLASEDVGVLEGNDEGSIFWGAMPALPVKAICVCGSDMRQRRDSDGARVMIYIRSDEDGSWPIEKSMQIADMLDGLNNILLVENGDYVVRVTVENGPSFVGLISNATQAYSINLRVHYC